MTAENPGVLESCLNADLRSDSMSLNILAAVVPRGKNHVCI